MIPNNNLTAATRAIQDSKPTDTSSAESGFISNNIWKNFIQLAQQGGKRKMEFEGEASNSNEKVMKMEL